MYDDWLNYRRAQHVTGPPRTPHLNFGRSAPFSLGRPRGNLTQNRRASKIYQSYPLPPHHSSLSSGPLSSHA
jgi:hypothetical protein